MSTVILGTGLMGTAFAQEFPEAYQLGRSQLDITQEHLIAPVLDPLDPQLIINCAAYTQVDKAESEPEYANLVNGIAVSYLANYAQKKNITLIHFSTDYVFDGQAENPYIETDLPNPVNAYGYSKWLGEKELKKCDSHYLFRIQWIYGHNGANFIAAIQKKARESGHLDVVNDQWGSPSWSVDLAKAIRTFLTHTPPYGTYHACAKGYTTWHGFAAEILKQTGIPATLHAVTSDTYTRPAKRPKNGRLNCEKFSKYAQPDLWEASLKRYLQC